MNTESPSNADASGKLNPEIYVDDGDYIRDIEINDLRNRYTLTKGSTQKMVITPMSFADTPEGSGNVHLAWIYPCYFLLHF